MGAPQRLEPAAGRTARGLDPEGGPGPGLGWVLALAALALAWSWWRIDGYPLADVVEDVEWTDALLSGRHVLDSEATRPFGYLVLLAPAVLLGRLGAGLTGGGELALAMQLARLFQVAATLLLVALTARFARRSAAAAGIDLRGARTAGLAAGVLLALNPLVLRWGPEPISGITTGIFVLLSAERILFDDGRTPARRGLLAGLALGAAALTAYKSIAIVAPVFLFGLALGRRLRLSRAWLAGGFALCLLAQAALDRVYHGAFGESLRVYTLQNIGNIVPVVLHRLWELTGSETIRRVAWRVYDAAREVHMLDYPRDVPGHQRVADVTSLQSKYWYLTHLYQALTWPGLVLAALGLARALGSRARGLLVPAVAVVVYVGLMSYKGSKDYRLWLPILSFVAALGGLGAAWLAARGAAGALVAGLALAAAGVLGPLTHARANRAQFAGYWRAVEHVNAEVAAGAGGPRLASAFHWAVYARSGPGVELIKLPHHLDGWERHDEAQRGESLAALAELDWFVAHLALVTSRRELCEALGRDFEVVAGYFRPATEASPGPVLVFRRRAAGEPERGHGGALLRALAGGEAGSAERGLGPPLGFVDPAAAEAGQLRFLGYELFRLAGDGLGWIDLRWQGARTPQDLRLLARVTAGDATVWSGDHAPGHGLLPTSGWPASEAGGLLLVEGYPVLEPWWGRPEAELWIGVAAPSEGGERLLRAVRPADGRPVAELSPPGGQPTPEGWRTVEAGLVRVGPAVVD